jgi:hypothetical protein
MLACRGIVALVLAFIIVAMLGRYCPEQKIGARAHCLCIKSNRFVRSFGRSVSPRQSSNPLPSDGEAVRHRARPAAGSLPTASSMGCGPLR